MDNWLALYLAAIWHNEISPEHAMGIVEGKTRLKIKQRTAVRKTESAKTQINTLTVGQIVTVTVRKAIYTATIVSKNDKLLTVQDDNKRMHTIHIADLITREVVVK